ncbi:siderophore-interacting protein [Allostreptomyces psammosilenae]|uniref:NADPH-dependent ferric siderophore reductase n=1 Tax=Allostreptomyces psammosilenae TaxID=1892865 RepID=A0A852ZQZ0_9ACTN|nr:siderophore-interacting protein [Allostreptomyces psammosilenae]NYI04866.1 NADPH-dependent ferric siderophore reductase [Allostreptomyces psammosilenae]
MPAAAPDSPRAGRPGPRTLDVLRTRRLTPRMVRVTLGGPALSGFTVAGPASRVKIFLPTAESGGVPVLPGNPDGLRPVRRTYTVRALRTAPDELDLDFVVHADGPAGAWAAQAAPGQRIAVSEARGEHVPHTEGHDWLLFAGDETALPAIAAMLEALPEGVRARAFVEVADAAEEQPLETAADLETVWLHREPAGHAPGRALVEGVRAATWWKGDGHAWVAGESSAVRDLRAHLQAERGLPRQSLYASGYWKLGSAEG